MLSAAQEHSTPDRQVTRCEHFSAFRLRCVAEYLCSPSSTTSSRIASRPASPQARELKLDGHPEAPHHPFLLFGRNPEPLQLGKQAVLNLSAIMLSGAFSWFSVKLGRDLSDPANTAR
jgi:hypothetical protein